MEAVQDGMEIVGARQLPTLANLSSTSSSNHFSSASASSSSSSASVVVKSESHSQSPYTTNSTAANMSGVQPPPPPSAASSDSADDGVEILDKGSYHVHPVWKKDPHYDYSQDYSVSIVSRGDGDDWSELGCVFDSSGKRIFIGRPGASFGIRVSRNNFGTRRPLVRVLIDGRDIGYYHYFGSQELVYIFKGFQSDGNFTSYHSFVFATTMPMDEKPRLVKKEEPDVARGIGSIVCKFFDYEYQTFPMHKAHTLPAMPLSNANLNALTTLYANSAAAGMAPSVAAAQAPFAHQLRRPAAVSKGNRDDGVKFWQRPGLSTSSSSTVAIRCNSEQGRGRAVQKEALCVIEHRYDSAEYLELRGLLSRDNPAHAQYLRAHEPVSQQRRDAFSSAMVKLEKEADNGRTLQHTQQRVKVKKENHTQELCDLTADDGEEKWTARKKVKHERYELLDESERPHTNAS